MKKTELSLKLALNGIKQHLEDRYPYTIEVLGEKITICKNVWSPKHSKSTEFFAKHLGVKRGQTVIEMGCGSGALSIIACKKGASKVLAIDISKDAVKCTKLNAKKHGLKNKITVSQSDLFQSIPNMQADLIIFNPPFTNAKKKIASPLDLAVFDPNHRKVDMFLKQAKAYLKPGGKIRIGFSVSVGNPAILKKIFRKNSYTSRLVISRKLPHRHHQIYELKPSDEGQTFNFNSL